MTTPNPADVARRLIQRVPAAVPESPAALVAPAVLFSYVDNSNVWIEGRRIQAVREGRARDPYEAMERKVFGHWSYDFGRLYELACPLGSMVGRSLLIGSKPPPNDSVWARARDEGFQVEVFERRYFGKEKQVDASIGTVMLEDSYEHMNAERGDLAVLVAGDADYLPQIRSLQRRGLRVRVLFWMHATSNDLRATADEFIALDPFFDRLTLPTVCPAGPFSAADRDDR